MKILDALLVLKEQAINNCVDEPLYGICYNLLELTLDRSASYGFVINNCKDWEHFSGNIGWPVVFPNVCGLWEGEQLELRLSLLDHLITKAKQQGV